MNGLAIFLIFILVGIITSPGSVGRWAADVRRSYDERIVALQEQGGGD